MQQLIADKGHVMSNVEKTVNFGFCEVPLAGRVVDSQPPEVRRTRGPSSLSSSSLTAVAWILGIPGTLA